MLARQISSQQFENDFECFYEAYYYNDKNNIIRDLLRKDKCSVKSRIKTINSILSCERSYCLNIFQVSFLHKDLKIEKLKEESGKYSIFKSKHTMLAFLEKFFKNFLIESIDNIISMTSRFNFSLLSTLKKYKNIIEKDVSKFMIIKFNEINPGNEDLFVPTIYDEIIKRKKTFKISYENKKVKLEILKVMVGNGKVNFRMKDNAGSYFLHSYSGSEEIYTLYKEPYSYINNFFNIINEGYKRAGEFAI